MKLIKKNSIYTGDIYESLTDGKIVYEFFLNRFYMSEILPEGILVKKDAKLMKVKYEDAYIDIEDKRFNKLNLLYVNFYQEHKSVNDWISLLLKKPKLNYVYRFTKDKGDMYVTNLKKYYDESDRKKISIRKAKKL